MKCNDDKDPNNFWITLKCIYIEISIFIIYITLNVMILLSTNSRQPHLCCFTLLQFQLSLVNFAELLIYIGPNQNLINLAVCSVKIKPCIWIHFIRCFSFFCFYQYIFCVVIPYKEPEEQYMELAIPLMLLK